MRPFYFTMLLVGSLVFSNQSFSATELEDRARISKTAQDAFLRGDFSRLEETSRSYRTTKNRTASGIWKLTLFYSGISIGIDAEAKANAKQQEAAYRKLNDKTKKWAQQYPDSPSAHIAQSIVHISHAWAYRGGGYAASVKPEAWPLFRKYISLARQNLETHKTVAAADPRWYETMLTVARAEGWERSKFDNLLNEALDREPSFYETYFSALNYLLPQWSGGTREIEEFARKAAQRTLKQEGRGMYARIYWFASQTHFENDLFSKSFAAWPLMKNGFEDIIARYPDDWNLNNYAKFACLAHDKPKVRELMKRIERSIVVEAWEPIALREVMKRLEPPIGGGEWEPISLLQQCSDWAVEDQAIRPSAAAKKRAAP